jgi:subtilisin family serine protease
MKEYVISLKKGYVKDDIVHLLRSSSGDSAIPTRTVSVDDHLPLDRSFFAMLTEREANCLEKDPRVFSVTPKDDLNSISFAGQQSGPWARNGTTNRNWGIKRHTSIDNPWTTSSDILQNTYDYHLDGTGVDYVHIEDMFRHTHDEFKDANGNSRFIPFQWNTLSGLSDLPTINYNALGYGGHSTATCSGVVGRNVGWAKNATIYAIPWNVINTTTAITILKEFHRLKPVDPITGHKRPTVTNASFVYTFNHTNISDIFYRGRYLGVTSPSTSYGLFGGSSTRESGLYSFIEQMEDEGVILVAAAGNSSQKLCENSNDQDFDNHVLIGSSRFYYCRSTGVMTENTPVVGHLSTTMSGGLEYQAGGSSRGPRVDVWAAGSSIVCASSGSDTGYTVNSGSSHAAPQVTGMVCCLLQENPDMTARQVKNWLRGTSAKNKMFQGITNESDPGFWSNSSSLLNGGNRIAVLPYIGNLPLNVKATISGLNVNQPIMSS